MRDVYCCWCYGTCNLSFWPLRVRILFKMSQHKKGHCYVTVTTTLLAPRAPAFLLIFRSFYNSTTRQADWAGELFKPSIAGVGNLFTIKGRINRGWSLASRKINWFDAKILPFSNYEEEWLLLTNHRSTCSSWSFVLTRCCALTGVTKIVMRAISNVHAAPGPCSIDSGSLVVQML